MKRPIGMWLFTMLLAAICADRSFAGDFYEPGGVAIRGYDPVAYFEERRPVQGLLSWTTRNWLEVRKAAKVHQ